MDFLTEHAPLSAGVPWWCWGAMYLKHSVFNALSAQGTVLHLYCTFHADVPKNEMKSEISDDWQAWGRMRQNNTKGARGDVTGYFPTTTVFDGWFVELVVLCLIFSFPSFSVVCFLTPVCNALDEERFHIMKGKVPFQFVRAGAQREGADGKCSLQTLAV